MAMSASPEAISLALATEAPEDSTVILISGRFLWAMLEIAPASG